MTHHNSSWGTKNCSYSLHMRQLLKLNASTFGARNFLEIYMISLDKADLSAKIAELIALSKSISLDLAELIALRKSISLDLKVIAEKTKIPTQMLKNIELKNFDKLPPEPIGRSFIKQYISIIEKESKNLR
tara:strand:- start:2193 stop:2585 length:393 start_codon:yes stop_codon:yes gene_type:complete